jgi:ABC-2 type transport system permease protein
VPFVLTLNLLPGDPHNGLATALSFVPFFSQTVMPARYALGVAPLWQVAVAALLALGAVAVVVRAAGRIYRNSVLRTGARVPLREAWGARAPADVLDRPPRAPSALTRAVERGRGSRRRA